MARQEILHGHICLNSFQHVFQNSFEDTDMLGIFEELFTFVEVATVSTFPGNLSITDKDFAAFKIVV
jgi:hypothetical protein